MLYGHKVEITPWGKGSKIGESDISLRETESPRNDRVLRSLLDLVGGKSNTQNRTCKNQSQTVVIQSQCNPLSVLAIIRGNPDR